MVGSRRKREPVGPTRSAETRQHTETESIARSVARGNATVSVSRESVQTIVYLVGAEWEEAIEADSCDGEDTSQHCVQGVSVSVCACAVCVCPFVCVCACVRACLNFCLSARARVLLPAYTARMQARSLSVARAWAQHSLQRQAYRHKCTRSTQHARRNGQRAFAVQPRHGCCCLFPAQTAAAARACDCSQLWLRPCRRWPPGAVKPALAQSTWPGSALQ